MSNTGGAASTISTPLLSLLQTGKSDEFVVANYCLLPLAAGKSCTITVCLHRGCVLHTPQTATLEIMDNAPGSPQPVALSATVLDPADDHLHHQPTGKRRLQRELHGGGESFQRAPGNLHEFRGVQQFGRNLHHDRRHGNVLGDRQSGRQLYLCGGSPGYKVRKCDYGHADNHIHHQPTGERRLQCQLHGGGESFKRATR